MRDHSLPCILTLSSGPLLPQVCLVLVQWMINWPVIIFNKEIALWKKDISVIPVWKKKHTNLPTTTLTIVLKMPICSLICWVTFVACVNVPDEFWQLNSLYVHELHHFHFISFVPNCAKSNVENPTFFIHMIFCTSKSYILKVVSLKVWAGDKTMLSRPTWHDNRIFGFFFWSNQKWRQCSSCSGLYLYLARELWV